MLANSETEHTLDIDVRWAPAFELLVSFLTFVERDKHCLEELGTDWLARVRRGLPQDFGASRAAQTLKRDHQLLTRLALGAPHAQAQHADEWLAWFAQLSAGGAYEVLASVMSTDDPPQLPRDFTTWRDRFAAALNTWCHDFFAYLDPTILEGLRAEADSLRQRVEDGATPPRELVDEATNGIWIDADSGVRRVVLIPQFHQRPYNDECSVDGGVLLLYPADSVARETEALPLGLLRLTRGLADESRLKILRFLAQGSRSLTDVARFAELSQPTVHHHLARLRAAGLVRNHITAGHNRRYSLRPHAVEQLSMQLTNYLEVPG